MRQISGCDAGACPAIYEHDGDLIVQGIWYGPGDGAGEVRVWIPRITLVEAAKWLEEERPTEPMRAVPEPRVEPRLWANADTQPAVVDWFGEPARLTAV
jgi:hypothetical protein